MGASIEALSETLAKGARRLEPWGRLLVRTSLGATFASTGYGKLTHLERTIAFFAELGIPAPEIQAPFVGVVELLGGLCIALGLATRVVAVPLAGTMAVAIGTALWPEVGGALDLITLDETLYLVLFVWLVAAGPGAWSLDHWLWRRRSLSRRNVTAREPSVLSAS